MPSILFKNAALLDPLQPELLEGHDVLVEDSLIKEVSDRPIKATADRTIDLKGKTLMPGLIDLHVHTIAIELNLAQQVHMPNVLVTLRSTLLLRGMLRRGFTTVRDAGGAGHATEAGDRDRPDRRSAAVRLRPCAQPDRRPRRHARALGLPRQRRAVPLLRARRCAGARCRRRRRRAQGGARGAADGRRPDQDHGVRRRRLADRSGRRLRLLRGRDPRHRRGGAAAGRPMCSPMPIPLPAIARAVRCGVRTIEHGNLVDEPTARLMAEKGAYVVPTLVTYEALANEGAQYGLPPESVAKIADVRDAGLRSLEIYRDAGVKMGFGSDLLGPSQRLQSDEFRIRAEILGAREVIASATLIGAEVLGMEGKLGRIVPDAFADLLVVDGNPLRDVACLLGQGERIPLVMKAGKVQFDRLAA